MKKFKSLLLAPYLLSLISTTSSCDFSRNKYSFYPGTFVCKDTIGNFTDFKFVVSFISKETFDKADKLNVVYDIFRETYFSIQLTYLDTSTNTVTTYPFTNMTGSFGNPSYTNDEKSYDDQEFISVRYSLAYTKSLNGCFYEISRLPFLDDSQRLIFYLDK